MKKVLVVGYGNTLRGDDGLGPLIARQIDDALQPGWPEVRVACLPQLDISLVSDIKDMDTIIFVDARQDNDGAPVTVKSIESNNTSTYSGHTTHSLGVPALLKIARDWYGRKLRCYLVMPKGYDFSISDAISTQGLRSAAIAVERIIKIISSDKGV